MSQNRLGVPIVPEALTQPEQRNVTLRAGVPICADCAEYFGPSCAGDIRGRRMTLFGHVERDKKRDEFYNS